MKRPRVLPADDHPLLNRIGAARRNKKEEREARIPIPPMCASVADLTHAPTAGASATVTGFLEKSEKRLGEGAEAAARFSALMTIPVVGIGASAGGLEAVRLLLSHVPADTGLAFVFVQHLDPKHHSNLSEILAGVSAIPVHQATDRLEIKPNHLYVIPPDAELEIANQALRMTPRAPAPSGLHAPIDHFLRSLAQECGSGAIGVILSGAGTDGAAGLEAVKAAGGVTFAQEPTTAKFDSMPQAAIGRECVDFILSPDAIAEELTKLGRHPYMAVDEQTGPSKPIAATKDEFDPILTLLHNATGVDFALYRGNTIQRRILRRLALHSIGSLEEYRQRLENDASELSALHRDLLINVTRFFRDAESFEHLKQLVFPPLVEHRPADAAIRIWVAGCATGEEAYSIAIALQEFFDETGHVYPVQIFASDISATAIEKARSGKFSETITADVSPERLNRHFSKVDEGYQISKRLRDMCVFSRHDLIKDPPFSKLDLISCQNVLIFFGSVRKSVIARFHYALKPGGFLVLGRSETDSGSLFSMVEGTHSLYTKVETAGKRRLFYAGAAGTGGSVDSYRGQAGMPADESAEGMDLRKELERALLSRYSGAGVLVDDELEVLEILGQPTPYFKLPTGKASLNLLKLIPETRLFLEIEKLVSGVKSSGHAARKDRIPYPADGVAGEVTVEVIPLGAVPSRRLLVLLEPAPGRPPIEGELNADPRDREIATLKQDLADARQRLLSIIEEHQSSWLENQDTVEEAISANEELQSLNEELETAKEELQSTNEELITVNQELLTNNAALTEARDFAKLIIETAAAPLLVLDHELKIQSANPSFSRAFQISLDEIKDQPLYLVSNGCWDIPQLRDMLQHILPDRKSVQDFEIERDSPGLGRRVLRVSARQLDGLQQILLGMEDITESKERELRLAAIVDSSDDAILSKTLDGTIVTWNSGAEKMYGYAAHEIVGRPITILAPHGQEDEMLAIMERIRRGEKVRHFETKRRRKDSEIIDVSVTISPIAGRDGMFTGVSMVARDITERTRAEHALQESATLNRAILNSLSANIAVLKADGKIQAVNEAWERFARANGDPPACVVSTGVDYLEVCRRSAAHGSTDAEKALAGIQDVLAGRRPSFETQYPCHSPSEKKWFRMLVTPLTGAVGGGAVITHVNITERKQAEQRFRLAVEAAPSGMVMADADGKIVLVNSRTEKLFGYDRQELLGKPLEMLVPESSREGHEDPRQQLFARLLAHPMGVGQDLYARRRDGTQFPVEIGLNPVETEEGTWVLSSIVDITDRKRAEAKLRESEERFRVTFFQAAVGIAQTSIDGQWLLLNRRFCEILGYSRDELRGKTFIDITHADDRELVLTARRKLLAGEISSWSSEKRYIRKDGNTVWARVFVSLVRNQHNEPQYFISVVEDITEKKQAERALQQSRQELRALAGRLIHAEEEERKRISRELHDDLSQKLALLAFDAGSLVLAPPPSLEEMKEPLRNLQSRVVQLSQDVRQISHRLHPAILEDLGLMAALQELCEEFSAREGIEAVLEQEAMPKALPVDLASCLYRVSQEALHNVSKHARASRVRLKVSGSPEGIRLCIHDTGVGFDSETASSRHGLGIVSMKERVRLVQGQFSVYSQPGEGTTVEIFVPLPREIT